MNCRMCGRPIPSVTNALDVCEACKEYYQPNRQSDDLRDQFAMAALQGITSNTGIINGRIVEDIAWLTETCYAMADAMIKERDK